MKRSAEISECGKYRWWLQRRWADGPLVCFVMLNPSKADGEQDDPTIRRCIGYAQDWGFGALSVRNLFPWRDTHPKKMFQALTRGEDITGGSRGRIELAAAKTADLIIAGWGANGTMAGEKTFLEVTNPAPVWCLKIIQGGKPIHPLFQAGSLTPIPWRRCDGFSWDDFKRERTVRE